MALDVNAVAAFLLVLARTSAWVMVAPFFGTRGIGTVGRLALAMSLALFIAPVAGPLSAPADIGPFVVVVVGQVIVGLILGWATGLLLHAFEVAGSLIDTSSGLAIGSVFDPLSGNHAAVFARFANLLFLTLLVATNAHHALLAGFVRSFQAVPADSMPALAASGDAAGAVIRGVAGVVLAAIEIGAPVLGALLLTEVGLALAARFAPQANVFILGLPVKVLVTLLTLGSALVLLPSRLEALVDVSLRLAGNLIG